MELAKHRIPTEIGRTIKVYPFGDVHLGAAACDERAAKVTRDLIAADPNAYWIGMGDLADAIMPSDPRWTARVLNWPGLGRRRDGTPDVDDLANATVQYVDEFFAPIWDKCLGLLEGNHEQSLKHWYYTDLIKRLCHRHDVPYLGQTAIVRLELTVPEAKQCAVVDIFAEHGATGGGTDGNSINNLLKRLEQFRADVYLKGHVHKRSIIKKSEIGWGTYGLRRHERVVQLTGTYLHGYTEGDTTYAERKALPPGEIGGTVTLLKLVREGRSVGPRGQREDQRYVRVAIDAIYPEALALLSEIAS